MVCEEWIQGGQRWRHQLGGYCSPPGENDQAGLSHGHGKEDLDDGSDWLGRPAHLPKWGGVGSRDQGLLTVVRKPGGAAGLRCQVGKTHDSVPSDGSLRYQMGIATHSSGFVLTGQAHPLRVCPIRHITSKT